MLNSVSFTSLYYTKIKKPKGKHSTKKEIKKENNYMKFQEFCDILSHEIKGSVFSIEETFDSKHRLQRGKSSIYVPVEYDKMVESYLAYNNVKFKKA